MRFSVWPNPQQPWSEILALATYAEQTGWDGVWFADHFMPNAEDTAPPVNEAWTVLAALAAAVPRVRLGPLVSGNTYRHPAVLAKMAAGIDIISGGRFVLGIGSGWQENEHAAYGLEFDTVAGRLRRLDEACQVITALFRNEKSDFEGRYYTLKDAPLAPKPVQQPIPLLIGGGGEKVTLKLVAKYADEWNTWADPALMVHKMAILDRHCESVGRDPKAIQRSAVAMLALSDDPAYVERIKGSGRPVVGGSSADVRATMEQYIAAGVDEFIIPDFNLGGGERRKETYDRFMAEVIAPLR